MHLAKICCCACIILAVVTLSLAQTYLKADGKTDTYKLINSVLGGKAVEDPDCAHKSFGQHIRQGKDETLGRDVFLFYLHVTPDNDRCNGLTDRQRNEIKTYGSSPENLKGRRGETVSFSWNFKLDSKFRPSGAFTHIHQIKAGDGDSGSPIFTITPRYKSNGNILELILVDSKRKKSVLKTTSLSPFLGAWVHVTESITYDFAGKLSIKFIDLVSKKTLFEYSSSKIDTWRNKATFSRPKWGIYRGLGDKSRLRDEIVRFDTFCLGKGRQSCD